MWKRVWGALDSVLSFVGFATLVLLGFRYWRGLPLSPWPAATPTTIAAPPQNAAAPSAPASGAAPRELPPIVALGGGENSISAIASAANSAANSAEPAGAPSASGTPFVASAPALKDAHDWGREVVVTVNASRYVKSLADLAPVTASLPESVRRDFKAAQAQAAGKEMLMVCNVTVEYSGREEVTLDQSGFRLVSPEREVFPAISCPFSTRDLQPLRATLLANGSARGDLVFPVKRGVQPEEILYNP